MAALFLIVNTQGTGRIREQFAHQTSSSQTGRHLVSLETSPQDMQRNLHQIAIEMAIYFPRCMQEYGMCSQHEEAVPAKLPYHGQTAPY
jgi:hypothetical protein